MASSVFLGEATIPVLEGSKLVHVPIYRTGDLSEQTTIHFATTNDTAKAGQDYVRVSGSITLGPNENHALVPVQLIDDKQREPTEFFVFSITSVDNGDLSAPRTTQIRLLDNERHAQDLHQSPLRGTYDISEIDVLSGLDTPLRLTFMPNNGNLAYIVEKCGVIKLADMSTGHILSTFLDISDIVNDNSDRGLLDVVIDPNFEERPYIYASYVVDPPETASKSGNAGQDGAGNRFVHVVRYTADVATGYKTVVPGSEKIILGAAGKSLNDISGGGAIDSTENLDAADSSLDQTGRSGPHLFEDDYIKVDSRSHAGGALAFGPDGALYVSVGDGTSFNAMDPRTLSVQSLNSLSGKILRIDPDTGLGLADNPFVAPDVPLEANRSKVYQLGLRNPYSMSFDSDGRLIVTDTGWSDFEEINSGGPGANFGWPFYEGGDAGQLRRTHDYGELPQAKAFYAAVESGEIHITTALRAFSHKGAPGGFQVQAITGGSVDYDGGQYPTRLLDKYFFSDFADAEVYTLDLNSNTVKFLYKPAGLYGPVDFVQGPDGYVYYTSVWHGKVGRLSITDGHEMGVAGQVEAMHGCQHGDTFCVDDIGDRVIEAPGGGYDTTFATINFAIGRQSIEFVRLLGSDDLNATGNKYKNELIGNSGSNVIIGGQGRDILVGGGGDDVFKFLAESDSLPLKNRVDVIRDFAKRDDDIIDMHLLDARASSQDHNDAFRFIGGAEFHDRAGELRYDHVGRHATIVKADTNGDGRADFAIILTGIHKMTAGEFDL